MRPSLSQPSQGTHPFGDTSAEERLRGLDSEQLADRLTWLSWWSPGTFAVVMDYLEFVDNLTADDGNDDDTDDPAPHCTVCGGEVGIFVPLQPELAALPDDRRGEPGVVRPRPRARCRLAHCPG